MAKITKAQASDQEIIVVRNRNTNKIERIVIPSDVIMGVAGYNLADLTVLGSIRAGIGASGVLKLPDGTNTIQQGSNITVTYNDNGTVTITGVAGGTLTDGDKGDITVSSSGNTWTIDSGVVTNAKLATMATSTIKGRVTAGTGAPEDLTGTQATSLLDEFTTAAKGLVPPPGSATGLYLKDDGTWDTPSTDAIVDGDKGDITVSSSGATWTIDNSAVTYAKIQNVSATDRILGRSSAGAGVIEEITCTAAGRALLDDASASAQRTTLGLGTLATKSTVDTADITNDAVTNAKLSNVATSTIKGRASAGTGDPEDLTGTQATMLLDEFTAGAKGLVPPPGAAIGLYLKDDGSWDSPLTSPAGSNTQVQFNDDGSFGAKSTLTFATGSDRLSVPHLSASTVTASFVSPSARLTIRPQNSSAAAASDVFFFVSGSRGGTDRALFGGDVVVSGSLSAAYGLTGSLTKLYDGSDFLVAGANITLTTGSSGNVTIAAASGVTVAGSDSQVQFNDVGALGAKSTLTFATGTDRLSVPHLSASTVTASFISPSSLLTIRPQGSSVVAGSDVFFFVSGSTSGTGKALFGGDVVISGSLKSAYGLTGSLTKLYDGADYLIAGSNITLTTGSNGSVTIEASGSVGNSSIVKIAFNETPAGSIDGSNKVFTLANVPAPTGSLQVFYNGALLTQGAGKDYTLSSQTITFESAFSAPAAGDTLLATYAWDLTNTTLYSYAFNESVTFSPSGPTYVATLVNTPNPSSTLMLFMNGQLLTQGAGADYTLAGAIVTLNFAGGVVGSDFFATYQY